jgi:AraC-like DNA-binding protein
MGHLQIEEITLPPGQEWEDAAAAWRFLHVSSGAAYWLETAKPRALAEHELIIVPPSLRAVIRASQICAVTLHGFSFAPETLCGFFTLAERQFFDGPHAPANQEVRFLPSTHPITQKFAAMIPEEGSAGLARRAQVLGLAGEVFDEQIAQCRVLAPPKTSAQNRFEQLVVQMPDTEIINHSPAELARLCGCSPRHFNRVFRTHFGVSVRARQTELRLLKARQLLESTEERVATVALACGYRNPSLFNLLFKRRFGLTPSEWRHRGNESVQPS